MARAGPWSPRWQHPRVQLAAAQAASAVGAIFIHPRANLGNRKDLVASRLVLQTHLRAALAHRIRLAALQRIKLGLIKQRPAVAGVPGLSPRLRPLARRCDRLGLPGPSDDGGLDELLESSLTGCSSHFSGTRSSALIAWHSGKDCGNCACAESGDSPLAAFIGCEGIARSSVIKSSTYNALFMLRAPPPQGRSRAGW